MTITAPLASLTGPLGEVPLVTSMDQAAARLRLEPKLPESTAAVG